MNDDYQDEDAVEYYPAMHGLGGPADKREIIVINGAGNKRNPDPRFHEIVAERDHKALCGYIQENYPGCIGMAHHHSLYK